MSLKLKALFYSLIIHSFVFLFSYVIISYMAHESFSKTYVEIDLSKVVTADLQRSGSNGGGGGGGGGSSSQKEALREALKEKHLANKALESKEEERAEGFESSEVPQDMSREDMISEVGFEASSGERKETSGLEGGEGTGSGIGGGIGSGMGKGIGSGIGAGIGSGIGKGIGSGIGEGVGSGKGGGYGSGEAETFLASKISLISQIVQQRISYPYMARRLGLEGKVVVSFLLTKEGEVKEIRIEESSSHKLLDENAVETIKKCSSLFPVPPTDVKVKLPISYRLERALK